MFAFIIWYVFGVLRTFDREEVQSAGHAILIGFAINRCMVIFGCALCFVGPLAPKVTGHMRWRQNPQRGPENAKLCLLKFNVYFFVSPVIYNSFYFCNLFYGKTGQLTCSLMKISSSHTSPGNVMKQKFRHVSHWSQGATN